MVLLKNVFWYRYVVSRGSHSLFIWGSPCDEISLGVPYLVSRILRGVSPHRGHIFPSHPPISSFHTVLAHQPFIELVKGFPFFYRGRDAMHPIYQ